VTEIVPVVTAYEVCAVPPDEAGNYLSWIVTVERTHHSGKWAVRRGKRCYDADGVWDWEPLPSSRTDEWLANYRFDLETALRIAKEVASEVKVNGYTVADALAWRD
jgi:hypothetical protein